ncbi:MAG: YihY/virulence factor BrkB family protein [Deltaproteobacteria bacterium]|nr:YihY/virulence factor BrkB family protein [Deltaproteobacteria bacterium]
MKSIFTKATQWILAVYKDYRTAEVPVRAAALAYHTILTVVPLIGLIFWYLTFIGVTEQWRQITRDFILTHLNVGTSHVFINQFEKLTKTVSGGGWGIIGLAVLVYSAWSLVQRIGDSLDFIFLGSIPSAGLLPSTRIFLRRSAAMLGLPLALMFSLAMMQWVRQDSWFHLLFAHPVVGPAFALPVGWFADITALFFLFYFVPYTRLSWKRALKAAVITGPLFEVIRMLFSKYYAHAVSVNKIYGVFAVLPVFILWLQVGWMIILTGALLSKQRDALN